MKNLSKAWVFVSHSSKDLEKVRKIRDQIEVQGGSPLLFFLKCLSDDDEIDDLIKREIESRNFFLLCDSANARRSRWVQDEIAHVKSLQGKHIEVVDLEADAKTHTSAVDAIIEKATVFLSYSRHDDALVKPFRDALVQNDFAVWVEADDSPAGDDWFEERNRAISNSARFGHFVIFLSNTALQSMWVQEELARFMEIGSESTLVPITLDPIESISSRLPIELRRVEWIDVHRLGVERATGLMLYRMGIGGQTRDME